MQESPIKITNRFQVLESNENITDEQQIDASHGTLFNYNWREIKHGRILGQKSCVNASTSVDISTSLEGNKTN